MFKTLHNYAREGSVETWMKDAVRMLYRKTWKRCGRTTSSPSNKDVKVFKQLHETVEAGLKALELEMNAWTTMLRPESVTLKTDPIQYWSVMVKSGFCTYPLLAFLARQILNTPASAVETERIWSTVAKVLTKGRANLKLSTAEKQVFLNFLWKMAEKNPDVMREFLFSSLSALSSILE